MRSTALNAPVAPSQPMIHTAPLGQEPSEFLSSREVAHTLGVALVSVYRLAERRVLPTYRIFRKLLFRRSDVATWIEQQRAPAYDDHLCQPKR